MGTEFAEKGFLELVSSGEIRKFTAVIGDS